ncbi:tetratricopeptide repeat protein, partial [Pectobacterium wasabiae]
WYTKAAEQGHAWAQYNLGVAYDNGEGVKKDPVQAVMWYTKAAEQNIPDAQYNLGLMYYSGKGIPQDSMLAHTWLSIALANGESEAYQLVMNLILKMKPEELLKSHNKLTEFREKFSIPDPVIS